MTRRVDLKGDYIPEDQAKISTVYVGGCVLGLIVETLSIQLHKLIQANAATVFEPVVLAGVW